jgi:hypothetical protein
MLEQKTFEVEATDAAASCKKAIAEIVLNSKVGKCGVCKGLNEKDPMDICEKCLQALEEESDRIFSLSQSMRMKN